MAGLSLVLTTSSPFTCRHSSISRFRHRSSLPPHILCIFRGWKMKNTSKGSSVSREEDSCVDGIERGIVSDSLNMSKEKKRKNTRFKT